jgi:membrane-associated phospholipid phosphatase
MKRFKILVVVLFASVSVYSQNIDVRVLDYINTPTPLAADPYFKFLSKTNTPINLAAPLGLFVAGYINKDKIMMRNAGATVAASALNLGVVLTLKYSINRTRPFKKYPQLIGNKLEANDPSFPSGHTSSAFATATSLSLAYPKWYVIVPSYAWAGSVAFSRMYLGVHYPTDVIVGALIGVGSAWLAYKSNQWLYVKYQK